MKEIHAAMTETKRISASELAQGPGKNGQCRIIDVRNPDEFEAVHVRGAENVPLMQLLDRASGWERNQPLVLICQQGPRSENAARQLQVAGFSDLSMVEGGTFACKRAGVPVVRGRRSFSVQQQMQLIVGSMVLTGAIGSLFFAPLIALALVGGCGLVFAAMTGYCPLATALARCPWNQPKETRRPLENAGPAAPAESCCGS
jgi:rhodanese-related sulfurtransferase